MFCPPNSLARNFWSNLPSATDELEISKTDAGPLNPTRSRTARLACDVIMTGSSQTDFVLTAISRRCEEFPAGSPARIASEQTAEARRRRGGRKRLLHHQAGRRQLLGICIRMSRSEEHTSELQSLRQ